VRLSRHWMKGMLERKWGRVLFSSSGAGLAPVAGFAAYSVTKTALISLARGLAELTKGTEVTVNCVVIGPTESDGLHDMVQTTAKATNVTEAQVMDGLLTSLSPSYALSRPETVDEIAAVFLFLASKHGLIVNGTSQRADANLVRHI